MRTIRSCSFSSCAWKDWHARAEEVTGMIVNCKKVRIYISCEIAHYNKDIDELNEEKRVLFESLTGKIQIRMNIQ